MRKSSVLLCLLFLAIVSIAQNDKAKSVKILHAKKLTDGRAKNYQKLIGKVGLQSGEMTLYCDSAEINQINSDFWAWGKVYMVRAGGEVKAWGDSLKFDGINRKGVMYGTPVKLQKGKEQLLTNRLYFDENRNVAYYLSGGEITKEDVKITSEIGYYFTKAETMHLRDSVLITHPDYTIYSDSLIYNVKQDFARFYGPTNIYKDEDHVYCERGFFSNPQEKFEFVKNAKIESKENTIFADSIWVDQKNEISKAYTNVLLRDTANKVDIYGQYAFFNQANSTSFVTDSVLFEQQMDGDTLFMTCDTLRALEVDSVKEFYAYHKVKLFKKDLQGKCDSLSYSFKDSLMRMYVDPVLWNDNSQMKGDTLQIFTQKNKLKTLYLFGNSSIISLTDSVGDLYDQIYGKNMIGHFKEGKIQSMDVLGNGQTLYFAKEDDGSYSGVNQAICANMRIVFKDQKIGRIVFLQQPVATFFPLNKLPKKEQKLTNFSWQQAQRPKSKADLWLK
jgi:lipopolysaccharide export system protein LptA